MSIDLFMFSIRIDLEPSEAGSAKFDPRSLLLGGCRSWTAPAFANLDSASE
jgi:hypothetical protein